MDTVSKTVAELVTLATLARALDPESAHLLSPPDRERVTGHLRQEAEGLRGRLYEPSPEGEYGARRFTGAVLTLTLAALEAKDLEGDLDTFPVQAAELLAEAVRQWEALA